MADCLVSVLCTAYNHEEYIRDALESIVTQQTDFPFEVLVNDDASTDGTAAILREYAAKYPDIIRPFYQEKNLYSQGKDLCLEVLYPAARGKYIALCEGDDYWTDPTKLQLQVDFLDAHPDYSACVHNTLAHTVGGEEPDRVLFEQGEDRDVPFEQVIRGMSHAFHTSSVVAKKSVIAHPADFFYVGLAHGFGDHPDGLWMITNGPVRYLDRCMSVYRMHSNNASWSTMVDGAYEKMLEYFQGKLELLNAYRPYASAERTAAVDQAILETEFEMMHYEGRDREQRKSPYDAILRRQSFSYRVKNLIKCLFPGLQKRYREKRGFRRLCLPGRAILLQRAYLEEKEVTRA